MLFGRPSALRCAWRGLAALQCRSVRSVRCATANKFRLKSVVTVPATRVSPFGTSPFGRLVHHLARNGHGPGWARLPPGAGDAGPPHWDCRRDFAGDAGLLPRLRRPRPTGVLTCVPLASSPSLLSSLSPAAQDWPAPSSCERASAADRTSSICGAVATAPLRLVGAAAACRTEMAHVDHHCHLSCLRGHRPLGGSGPSRSLHRFRLSDHGPVRPGHAVSGVVVEGPVGRSLLLRLCTDAHALPWKPSG